MTGEQKKQQAIDFINSIRAMAPDELTALINREVGDALGHFFHHYSERLLLKDPTRMVENTSGLMLMGYLIRVMEERPVLAASQLGVTQPPARA